MRIIKTAGLLALALGLVACGKLGLGTGDGSPTSPSGPPKAGATIIYSAVGASDVIGYGSSKVCLLYDDCNGNGYVWVAARQLRAQGFTVEIQQLGIPTGVISRTFQALGAQFGREILGNFIQQEVPFIRKDATLVTVFAGANDLNTVTGALGGGAGGSNPTAYIDQMVSAFGTDFTAMISGIRERAPAARIVVINLPNMAGTPYLATATLSQKQAAQRVAVRITTTVINPQPGISVIDLMCDSRLYEPAVFSADGFHPNDSGYAIIGAEIAAAVTSASYPGPRNSCSQMTLIP